MYDIFLHMLLVESVSKEVSLKLVEFSECKFYMQFGKYLYCVMKILMCNS